MKNQKILISIFIFSIFHFLGFYLQDDEKCRKISNRSDKHVTLTNTYYLNVNNIELPLNNKGTLANVTVPPYSSEAKFLGLPIIFSSGFILSGYSNFDTISNFVWANGVATSSRIHDYQAGRVGSNPLDPKNKLYVLKAVDQPFGTSWQEWRDAVSLGAYFYDGDGDGLYNPIDKNGNGQWDINEDRPDLLGDATVWCVYNDGVPSQERRYTDVPPFGIEVRQTVFASSKSDLSNTFFVRYSLLNRGTVSQVFDNVIFSIWSDPDLGDYQNDLAGSDTLINSCYTYNNGTDAVWGSQPPAIYMTFLQLPWTFTGNSQDTAFNHLGKFLGVEKKVGFRHTNLFSFIQYYCGGSYMGEPANRIELRHFAIGRDRIGRLVNPCTWHQGTVVGGVNCNQVNPVFFYSGNPVTNYGWISTTACDVRKMLSAGPFKLEANKPVDIIVAYSVGRGTDALNSILVAKQIVHKVINEYKNNFGILTSVNDRDIVELPFEFRLNQNYPNPFNSKTRIKFSIPNSGEVKLILYDILGREITTLLNEERQAGNYVYELDANKLSLSSGVYFYELKSGENAQIKRMIYLK